eukprot:COSAG02_NODE_562_length_20293_cov_37.104288_10_plen_93_part_00
MVLRHGAGRSTRGARRDECQWTEPRARAAVANMEWQWYHYVACIAFGVIMKILRNALGLNPRRATSVYLLRPNSQAAPARCGLSQIILSQLK